MSVRVGVKLMGVETLYGGDPAGFIEVARLAEQHGVDYVFLPDHLAISRAGASGYQGFGYPLDTPWYEPLSILSAIAAVTTRLRLGTHVLVAPLRPAILLAKQLATLDCLSHGRVDAGFGVGWQREEFASVGAPFEGRYGYLEEQIEACRALWSTAPASFRGKYVQFQDFYALPLPTQRERIPVWLGLAATPRNVERMARLGAGWAPPAMDAAQLGQGIAALRAAYAAVGRSPDGVRVIAGLRTLEDAPAQAAAGAEILLARIVPGCREAGEVPQFLERLVRLREQPHTLRGSTR